MGRRKVRNQKGSKQFAIKEDTEKFRADTKRIEDKMATKEQFEAIAISVEDSGRETVQYLLEQRGYKCTAERLRLDADYELDIYCNASAVTAVGEAKVRASGNDVEKALERVRELQRRQPKKIFDRLVSVLYTLVAEPPRRPKDKGAQSMAHREQERGRHARGGSGGLSTR